MSRRGWSRDSDSLFMRTMDHFVEFSGGPDRRFGLVVLGGVLDEWPCSVVRATARRCPDLYMVRNDDYWDRKLEHVQGGSYLQRYPRYSAFVPPC
jgi:hypothetical protein